MQIDLQKLMRQTLANQEAFCIDNDIQYTPHTYSDFDEHYEGFRKEGYSETQAQLLSWEKCEAMV